MNRPRPFIKSFLLTALISCALPLVAGAGHSREAYARQSNPQELYGTAKRHHEAGEYQKALDVLEDLLKTNPDYAPALLLKSRALVGLFIKTPPLQPGQADSPEARREGRIRQAKLLKASAESLEKFLQLKPDVEEADDLRERLESLRVYAEPAIKPESERTFFSSGEVTERAHILRRPEPRYPEEARAVRLSGTVKLLLVLAADGTVKHILALQSPDSVLTESAIEAASKIKFEPAIKDGHPVSTAVWVEYGFHTY
jgi:TonB family protein